MRDSFKSAFSIANCIDIFTNQQTRTTSPSSDEARHDDPWHRSMLRDWDSLDGREQSRLKSRLGGILLDEYAAQKKSKGSEKVRFRTLRLSKRVVLPLRAR